MFVIGITGPIGSGKSTIAGFLRELGAEIIDADEVGHSVYLPGSEGWKAVVEAFGSGVVAPDGTIDRKILGDIVFKDPASIQKLNTIVRPLISLKIHERLDELNKQGAKVVALEAALLVNAGWKPMVDELWVTTAPLAVIYRRMADKWCWTPAQVDQRIQAQPIAAEQAKFATRVIDTDVPLPKLKVRVAALWKDIQKKVNAR
jgi:dephospho-CoA kinase